MKHLKQFVNESRDASQTIFFGHYPTSTIGTAVGDIRKLFGSVLLTALCIVYNILGSVDNERFGD